MIETRLFGPALKQIKHSVAFKRHASVLSIHKMGNVTALELNRPEVKNQLDENTYSALCEALVQFEKDDTTTAGVIYGIGGNFCAGCSDNYFPDIAKLVNIAKKPLVAGLTGYATGVGFELALLCDLRVMEETAQLGMNGSPAIMSPMAYKRLVSITSLAYALDLSLTGRNVHFREAGQKGLIDRIVDCGTGIGQAVQLAKTIGKFPVNILREAKAAVYSAEDQH